MRYFVNAILCIAWSLLCFSEGLSLTGGVGQAAIFFIPAVLIGVSTASIARVV